MYKRIIEILKSAMITIKRAIIRRTYCFLFGHSWTDIIEDRVSMVNLSPEHYTTVEKEGCMKCFKEQIIKELLALDGKEARNKDNV